MIRFERRLHLAFQQVVRASAETAGRTELAAAAADEIAAQRDDGQALAPLGLTAEQEDLVWAIVACSIDGRLMPHLEQLAGAQTRRGLSVAVYALFAQLAGDSAARLAQWLATDNLLVRHGLLVAEDGVSPAARAYIASSRFIAFLRGDDCEIAPLRIVAPLGERAIRDDAQRAVIDSIGAALERGAVVVIEGPSGSGRVSACERELLVHDLANGVEPIAALARETLLRGVTPALANVDLVEDRRAVGAFLDRCAGAAVVTSSIPGLDLATRRPLVRIAWDQPGVAIREALWLRAVEASALALDGGVSQLAHRYRVGPDAITRAVASVALSGEQVVSEKHLVRGLRHNIAERLSGLATRVEVTQSWDDLVLSDDIRDSLVTLIGRVRHSRQVLDGWGFRKKIARGAGIPALFSGPPGTGKTMVAGLIAKELDLELYQVDLSKVVSKWVGETEKNLGRVFDAAEEGHGLLLFDEADSLFGQRSNDPQSSNDRHANLEVNYLLQRVEAFGGITILTTNLETAIDSALKRRLAAHVVFGAPDEDERAVLWERQLSTGSAPISSDIDVDALARLFPKMSGANIRNAALASAFMAAGEGAHAIAQDHLLRSGRAEYRNMGHVIANLGRSL